LNLEALWTWLFWGWVASEVIIAVATRTRQRGGKVQDRGSQLLLWIATGASVTACEWNRHVAPPNIWGGAHWLLPLSLIVMMAGLVVRGTAIFTLGKSFSANVAIRESQRVRRTGLYRFVRHPSYLGMLLVFLAIGLHSRNWASLAVVLLPTTAALLYRIHVEEAALREAFGEEYLAYSRVTKRLIPGVF
jgi:protein-S-isoprenylcysteine O-methyltransferase Ste14